MKRTLAHTTWECKYHIVFVPKNRRKVIYGKLRRDIGNILRKLCEYKQVEVIEGTACADHIHVCLSIPPKYSVATIVGYLKGKSTMIVFERFSSLRRNFRGHNFWARGYYVSTVGLDEQKVRQYIKNQQEQDAIVDRYDTDLVKDPFRGASSQAKEDGEE
ncbi:MAG: IS200/IS605 family transposase [Deltaproteobacteria bacterium]|nr:IS200/IS605 family transposase [Deltaproteobacteria bacterium]